MVSTFLKLYYCVFVTFHVQVAQTFFSLWTIYIIHCWHFVHNCQDNNIFGHFKSKLQLYFLGIHEGNTPQNSLFWSYEPNLEQDSFFIFMKSIKNIIKIWYPSINRSIRVGLYNNFLEALGLMVPDMTITLPELDS